MSNVWMTILFFGVPACLLGLAMIRWRKPLANLYSRYEARESTRFFRAPSAGMIAFVGIVGVALGIFGIVFGITRL